MKKPIENRFLSYCYNNEGEQNTEKYYFPEKNVVLSYIYSPEIPYLPKRSERTSCIVLLKSEYFMTLIIYLNFYFFNNFFERTTINTNIF